MRGFPFVDPGPLIDQELELVQPAKKWVDALLTSCTHPQSLADPRATSTTRARVLDFLRAAPDGHQPENLKVGIVPAYHFWMRVRPSPTNNCPIQIAGGIGLRIGDNEDLRMYLGHIGYNVYPPARGHHYAERSCRLLLRIAKHHGMTRLWITCNPDNIPSRRTCERLGCTMKEIVPLPIAHPLYLRGEREKCRYFLDL